MEIDPFHKIKFPHIYIHIPFCVKKCPYCDFFSVPYSHILAEKYVQFLKKEISLYNKIYDISGPDTVYFGGGTPGILPPNLLTSILPEKLLTNSSETTIEINPGIFNKDKIKQYLSAGINRFSIGVQSFHGNELKTLGRIHSAGEAEETLRILKELKVNFNADLIYGIPGQDRKSWQESLEILLGYNPKHISLYALTVEKNTPLEEMVARGDLIIPSDEEYHDFYAFACKILQEAGFVHYEISNWCLPEFISRHNLAYWSQEPYLGMGVSAHSYDGIKRWWNSSDFNSYFFKLSENKLPLLQTETLTAEQKTLEIIQTKLRTNRGLRWEELPQKIGESAQIAIKFLNKRYIPKEKYFSKLDGEGIALSEEGWWFHDEICSDIARFLP